MSENVVGFALTALLLLGGFVFGVSMWRHRPKPGEYVWFFGAFAPERRDDTEKTK